MSLSALQECMHDIQKNDHGVHTVSPSDIKPLMEVFTI
jgi:hypothetical protein